MEAYSTSRARTELAELVDRVAHGGERIVLTRHGLPMVALVPVDEAELLEELEDEHDRKAIAEARAEGGGIPFEEVLRERGIDPEQIRRAAALLLEEDARQANKT